MIRLTKLNRVSFALNADLIKSVENLRDTVITLTTGEKIIVLEDMEEVIAKTVEFRRSILSEPFSHALRTTSE